MAFIDRFSEPYWNPLGTYIGFQEGYALGTAEARQLIYEGLWVYDRQSGLVLEVRMSHEMVCYWLYLAYTGKEYKSVDCEQFLEQHMGFWMSSVAYERSVYVDRTFCLTAQERMAFSGIKFKKI